MPSLEAKLKAALASRDERLIRRRLAQPSTKSVDFTSNDYLSLSTYSPLRDLFITRLTAAPHVLGSGGSRLLVNGTAHSALETRLAAFFGAPTALLFNSGFDANVAIFSSLPQPGDIVVHDEAIHASVYDGIRASRIPEARHSFEHNCMRSLRTLLHRLRAENSGLGDGSTSVFVAVESLYSMDGTIAPLQEIVEIVGEMFPMNNGHVIVDEAHATGIYGLLGKGLVAMLELDDKVLVRLHTFGKALAGTGAVILTNETIRDYLLNYARPLIYTTSLGYANIVLAECSFDMLENGTADRLAAAVLNLSAHFLRLLRPKLAQIHPDLLDLPPHLLGPSAHKILPTPIIPIMTKYPRPLSTFLLAHGMNARPITWPTVPKGKDRLRVCLHAGNKTGDVEMLVEVILQWAEEAQRTWLVFDKVGQSKL